jgi:hypothetical protein
MDDGLSAAIRRFPEWRSTIETMAARDEDLRLLCEDLAEAEAAIALWEKSTSPHRDARVTEYKGLADGLAAELNAALDAVSIVPFTRTRRRPPQKHEDQS